MRKTVLATAAIVTMFAGGMAVATADRADAAKPDPHRMAACAAEDGGPVLPCVWDARHRGNGAGRSFVVRRDESVRYVTHRRAHKLTHGGVR